MLEISHSWYGCCERGAGRRGGWKDSEGGALLLLVGQVSFLEVGCLKRFGNRLILGLVSVVCLAVM